MFRFLLLLRNNSIFSLFCSPFPPSSLRMLWLSASACLLNVWVPQGSVLKAPPFLSVFILCDILHSHTYSCYPTLILLSPHTCKCLPTRWIPPEALQPSNFKKIKAKLILFLSKNQTKQQKHSSCSCTFQFHLIVSPSMCLPKPGSWLLIFFKGWGLIMLSRLDSNSVLKQSSTVVHHHTWHAYMHGYVHLFIISIFCLFIYVVRQDLTMLTMLDSNSWAQWRGFLFLQFPHPSSHEVLSFPGSQPLIPLPLPLHSPLSTLISPANK